MHDGTRTKWGEVYCESGMTVFLNETVWNNVTSTIDVTVKLYLECVRVKVKRSKLKAAFGVVR